MSDIALLTRQEEVLRAMERAHLDRSATRAITTETRIVISDDNVSDERFAPPCTIIVTDDGVSIVTGMERMSVGRESFLSDPGSYVKLCREVVRSREQLADVEQELAFARHVEDLMRSPEVDAVFEKVARTALDIAGEDAATLLLHDPVIERYVVAFSNDGGHRDNGEFLPGIPVDTLQSALESTELLAVRDGKPSVAVMPIQVGADLIGVVKVVLSSGKPRDAVLHAAQYIRSITPVLFNLHQLSKSKDLALRDDLTKAFNRRFFDTHLEEEMERARRYNSQLSIIFLDLDDLKLVNNLYGHLTGSRMLQEVAKRILGAVRAIDKVVRFGGDEFCIILPQTDPEQARAVASRVRRAMTEHAFLIEPGIEVPMTASFGISSFPTHALNKDDLIRTADAAMYSVKSSTKNAIAIATNSVVAPPETPKLTTHAE